MTSEGRGTILLAVIAVVAALAATAPLQPVPQAPRVESQQRSENSLDRQNPAQTKTPALINDASQNEHSKSGEVTGGSMFLGVKPGEWLIAAATLALWYATMRLVWDARETSERQLRAYLSVTIGAADYQDRPTKYRFNAKPFLTNNGATPAYNVRYQAVAKIIPDRIAATYQFQVPKVEKLSQASIGPREGRQMSALYPRFIRDQRVFPVMAGSGAALWVWGIVHYDDCFGRPRYTEFCQRLYFVTDPTGKITVNGVYDPRLGKST